MDVLQARAIPEPRSRIWRAGLLAALLATVANAGIRTVAVTLFDVAPDLRPFTWPQFVLFTLLGVAGATLVYAFVSSRFTNPNRTFRRLAVIVLLVSFIPDVALLVTQVVPGITVAAFVALSLMHITTAILSIRLLAGCPLGCQMP